MSNYEILAEPTSMHIDMDQLESARYENSEHTQRLHRTESVLNDKTERIRLRTLELEQRDEELVRKEKELNAQLEEERRRFEKSARDLELRQIQFEEQVRDESLRLKNLDANLKRQQDEIEQRLLEEMMRSLDDNQTYLASAEDFQTDVVSQDDAMEERSSSKSMSSISSEEGDEDLYEGSRSSCYDDLRSFARPVQDITRK